MEKLQIIFYVATFLCFAGLGEQTDVLRRFVMKHEKAPSESGPSSSARLELRVEPEVLFVMSQRVFLRLSSFWKNHRLRGV